jgi:hypothetical protein
MPPKAMANVDSLDAASVKFILSALKSCSEFAPDWSEVAKEHDIKYAKNAYVPSSCRHQPLMLTTSQTPQI